MSEGWMALLGFIAIVVGVFLILWRTRRKRERDGT
jgi:LPXTG-motif cell wall-anchored protein